MESHQITKEMFDAAFRQRLSEAGVPIVRAATSDDMLRLVEMGESFFAVSGCDDMTGWDGEEFAAVCTRMINSDKAAILIAEKDGWITGMAAALVFPVYFDPSRMMAQEMFWWVEPDSRSAGIGMALLQALEETVAAASAKTLTMIALDGLRPDALGHFYRLHGYRPLERHYIKRLDI